MAWIESHQGLARHIKTKRLARKLAVSVPAAIGHLHLLWWWSMDNTPDGNLSQLEPEDIADEMMWEGNADVLIRGLVDSGFVDEFEGKLVIHDFYDYVGKLVDKRKADAERKRIERSKSKVNTLDVQRMSIGQVLDDPSDGAGNSTVPNSTVQKKKKNTYPELFEQFWNTYPRQIEKSNAHKKWVTQINKGENAEDILTAAFNYMTMVSAKGTETEYMKHPKTFLNGDTWKEFLNPSISEKRTSIPQQQKKYLNEDVVYLGHSSGENDH